MSYELTKSEKQRAICFLKRFICNNNCHSITDVYNLLSAAPTAHSLFVNVFLGDPKDVKDSRGYKAYDERWSALFGCHLIPSLLQQRNYHEAAA